MTCVTKLRFVLENKRVLAYQVVDRDAGKDSVKDPVDFLLVGDRRDHLWNVVLWVVVVVVVVAAQGSTPKSKQPRQSKA